MEGSPIFCFQHCEKDVSVMCLALPERCPICDKEISSTPMRVPPFRLPCPFVDSIESPFSVVVKPTHGTFLLDYSKSSNLHIGVCNERGVVTHYNETGVHEDEDGWQQCLAVPLVERWDNLWEDLWRECVTTMSNDNKWLSSAYDAEMSNCYKFVLHFLQAMNLEKVYPCISDQAAFCEEMVVPHTAGAAKYITLYRKLLDDGVIVQYNTSL